MKPGRTAPANDPGRRADLERIYRAGLARVDPARAVHRALEEHAVRLSEADRIVVLAFGKASIPMAQAICDRLDGPPAEGVVVSNVPGRVEGLEVLVASHPVPDRSSLWAAQRVLELARRVGPRDVAVVAVSGGGSSLLTLPVEDVGLYHLAETTRLLLASGASIRELNVVRKHLSQIKGGRLAEALGEAAGVVTMILSDVVGNDLEVIASGPTVADHSTFGRALAILDDYGIAVPEPVREHLEKGAAGRFPETPTTAHPRQTIVVVGDAAAAAVGAAEQATLLGWSARVVDATVEGEAVDVAGRVVGEARSLSPGELLVYAGETTVTVRGDGTGGRNQELALAAAIGLAGDGGVSLLAAGTDGIDGLTSAAGGFADGATVERGRKLGLDAARYLQRNDSHTYLSAVGDVFVTGPTGTNVGDLILVARTG